MGSALPASFAAFPLPPHSSSWTGNTLPRQSPSLPLPWESGEDKPPLSCKHMGTREGAPPTHPKCILAEHHQAQYTGDKHKPRSGARAWVGSRRASTQPLEPSSKQEEPCQSSSVRLPPPKTPAPRFEPWRSVPAALQGLCRRGEAPAGAQPHGTGLPPSPPRQQLARFLSADTGCCSSECAAPSSPSPAPGDEGWAGKAGSHQASREQEHPE